MSKTTLYSQAIGINNKIEPHRLPFGEGGVVALESCVDFIVDRTGELVTRGGSLEIESGSFHSMFPAVDGFYVVEDRANDSALFRCVVNNDGTVDKVGVRSGLSSRARCDFTFLEGKTYYSNGYERGYLVFDESNPWDVNEWTGTDDNRVMDTFPVCQHIDIHEGRMIGSVDNEFFISEYGLLGLFDGVAGRRRMESRITMIASVNTGFYVSDEQYLYFVSGTNPEQYTMKQVLDYPAVEWGVNSKLINPSNMGIESNQLSVLFATSEGPVIGMPDGTAINLIDDKVSTPSCRTGAIMVVDESLILQS